MVVFLYSWKKMHVKSTVQWQEIAYNKTRHIAVITEYVYTPVLITATVEHKQYIPSNIRIVLLCLYAETKMSSFLMKVSSLAAPKVVILTTFGAASDEDFIKMKTFSFQCTPIQSVHDMISYHEMNSPLNLFLSFFDRCKCTSTYILTDTHALEA